MVSCPPLPVGVSWLLVGALATALTTIASLMYTIQIPESHRRIHRVGRRVMVASSAVIALLGFSGLAPIPLLTALSALLLAPAYFGFKVWVGTLAEQEGDMAEG